MIDGFRTSIAYIRSLIKAVTSLFDKIRTGLITSRAGSTFDVTEDNLAAYICSSAVVPVNAEVVGIKESAFMVPVRESVGFHFL